MIPSRNTTIAVFALLLAVVAAVSVAGRLHRWALERQELVELCQSTKLAHSDEEWVEINRRSKLRFLPPSQFRTWLIDLNLRNIETTERHLAELQRLRYSSVQALGSHSSVERISQLDADLLQRNEGQVIWQQASQAELKALEAWSSDLVPQR